MAYYMGDYYQGDYYQGGDPVFGMIVKGAMALGKPILRRIASKKTATAVATTAAGAVIGARTQPRPPPPGQIPRPGVKGTIQRFLPGGQTGYIKRRRMNPANPKALRRAIRRTDGFIRLAKRTLKGTGYTVKRTGGLPRRGKKKC